ncbi:pfs domain-containing protein [Colletotrichum musicola]|uniref:Pfs domain-containing protein n=1 Tax=Colletotrichum musicola TaxID=2175873 RepID=A0A8H6KF23_9PEZI|nr:pfs domain-containing protein [Colletotrichum musicola]
MRVDDVSFLLAILQVFQEAADILKTHEPSLASKIFFGDLKARCLMLHQDLSLVDKSRFEADICLIGQISYHLELVVGRGESAWRRDSSSQFICGSRLHAFREDWEKVSSQVDPTSKLEIARSWLGATPYDRRSFIEPLDTYTNDVRGRYLEPASKPTQDDQPPSVRMKIPPPSVCMAAQSIFDALVACKICKCKHPHEFDARFRLGTYRKPRLDPNLVNFELSFDTFLSCEQHWQETHFRATEELKPQAMVQFAINDDHGMDARPTRRDEKMVKRLCAHVKVMRSFASYRLELKVSHGKLFHLDPTVSTSLVDQTREAVSLAQVLVRPNAVSERAKYILAVLLSSAVFHLHESDFSDDSDDLNLNSFMQHQSPTIVSLAVVLMELYSRKPFTYLAEDYGVSWDETLGSSTAARYLNVCGVFKKWKEDVPENTRFLSAVDKCLDRRLWENEKRQPLEDAEFRTKFYDEVVKRLEVELSQAFSRTPIDELDEKAAELDFGNWDQMISPRTRQTRGSLSHWTAERVSDWSSTQTPSPPLGWQHQSLPLPHSQTQFHRLSDPTLHGEYAPSPHIYALSSATDRAVTSETDYKSMSFFDDGDVTKGSPKEALHRYQKWKLDYDAVYKTFIPNDIPILKSRPVKVAVLDTGIDMNHQKVGAREERIKGKYNWLNDKTVKSVPDRNGHGTFIACLLLDYAPDVGLYVAKIADNDPTSPGVIAKAIDHAVYEWEVDIISMSFGYPDKKREGYDELEQALERASSRHVLLFAAASNRGGKAPPSFPARDENVIAVYSTDTDGDRSKFSPTAMANELSLATVGEAVESAWPDDRVESKSGTSYATPIMAGIAAFLLQYAKIHIPDKVSALKKRKGMKAVLKKIAEKGERYKSRDDYNFVDVSLYWDGLFGKQKEFIDMTIRNVLDST